MRGSTCTVCCLPLTLTRTATFSMVSGIDVGHLDLFAAGAPQGDFNGALDERGNQSAFVFGGPAHIGLGIGGGVGRFHRGGNRLGGNGVTLQSFFSFGGANGGQSYAAKGDG